MRENKSWLTNGTVLTAVALTVWDRVLQTEIGDEVVLVATLTLRTGVVELCLAVRDFDVANGLVLGEEITVGADVAGESVLVETVRNGDQAAGFATGLKKVPCRANCACFVDLRNAVWNDSEAGGIVGRKNVSRDAL